MEPSAHAFVQSVVERQVARKLTRVTFMVMLASLIYLWRGGSPESVLLCMLLTLIAIVADQRWRSYKAGRAFRRLTGAKGVIVHVKVTVLRPEKTKAAS